MMKILISLLISSVIYGATIKVGVLAPEGTTWAKNLKKMAKEIKKATKKKVKIKIFFGGAQGDEPDVLRKIRVGQLHGGIFTGKTLGEINGDVRVMELPFTFYDDNKKARSVLDKMTPTFNKKFEQAKFKNLGFFEIGNVYFVSKNETANLAALKGQKIWAWEGDKLVESMIESMNLISVPLPLPDVLSSLSTGIIDAAYAPPLGILSLQWNTKVSHLIDFPLSYSIGAFLIGERAWKKISPENQKIVLDISKKYIAKVNEGNDKDNKDAMSAMKTSGINFLEFPKEDLAKGKELREQVVGKLMGTLFSKETYTQFTKELK